MFRSFCTQKSLISWAVFLFVSHAALASIESDKLKPEHFSGHYQFFEAELQGRLANPGEIPVDEVQIEVEKGANTLFITVLESRNPDLVGTDFLPPFKEINGEEQSVKTTTDWGCQVHSETAFTTDTSIQKRVRTDDKWLCAVRTSRIEETTQIKTSKKSSEMIEISRKNSAGLNELYRFVLLK